MQNYADFVDVILLYHPIAVLRPVPPLCINSIRVTQCVLDKNQGKKFFFSPYRSNRLCGQFNLPVKVYGSFSPGKDAEV